MDINKDFALAMLAGAMALQKSISREGGSTYVLDPFNKQGMKGEIPYATAEILLREVGLKAIKNIDGLEMLNIKTICDGDGFHREGNCPSCRANLKDSSTEYGVHFCPNCGQKVRW
jgi:hypothetical protein